MTVHNETPRRRGSWMEGDVAPPRALTATILFCTIFAALLHFALGLAYVLDVSDDVPWQPVAAIGVVVIAIASFGGFYLATGTMRIAIGASFILTYVVLLSFAISIDQFGTSDASTPFLDSYKDVVKVVVGFYFTSEAAVAATKVVTANRTDGDAATARAADVDLLRTRD